MTSLAQSMVRERSSISSPRSSRTISQRAQPSRASGRYVVLSRLRQFIERHLDDLNLLGTVIDLGCGDMPYRPLVESRGGEYIGVDVEENSLADITFDAVGHAPLNDDMANVVISTQVLEHVDDPAQYLDECRRLLRPGGRLLLTTHGVWRHHPHPIDLWRWTGQGLRHELADAGFNIIRIDGVLGLAATGALLLQDGVITRLPRVMRSSFAWSMQWIIALLDGLHTDSDRRDDACVYCILAENPGA